MLRQQPEKRPAGQPRGTVEAPSVSVPHAPEPGRALSREEPARGSPLQPAVSLESSPRQPGQLRQPGSAARRASGKPEIESSVRPGGTISTLMGGFQFRIESASL